MTGDLRDQLYPENGIRTFNWILYRTYLDLFKNTTIIPDIGQEEFSSHYRWNFARHKDHDHDCEETKELVRISLFTFELHKELDCEEEHVF